MKNLKQTEYLVKTFANHNDITCNSAKETLNYVHEKYICSLTLVEKLNLVRYLIIESFLKTKVPNSLQEAQGHIAHIRNITYNKQA